jgi:hypothetical protein
MDSSEDTIPAIFLGITIPEFKQKLKELEKEAALV